jgi:hypothetical protein
MTVGSGFEPDLLTLAASKGAQALAGLLEWASLPPVGIFTPP